MADQRWKSELEAVLESRCLARSPRLRELLAWLVTQAAEDRLDLLNEYDAARALKGTDDHDPALQSDIRKLLSRLRRVLREYYSTEGAANPCHIALPGGFVPRLLAPAPRPAPTQGELVIHFGNLQVVSGSSLETARVFESELLYRLGTQRGIVVQVGNPGPAGGAVLAGRIWGHETLSAVLQLIEVRTRILRAQARVDITGDIAGAASRAVEELCFSLRPGDHREETDE